MEKEMQDRCYHTAWSWSSLDFLTQPNKVTFRFWLLGLMLEAPLHPVPSRLETTKVPHFSHLTSAFQAGRQVWFLTRWENSTKSWGFSLSPRRGTNISSTIARKGPHGGPAASAPLSHTRACEGNRRWGFLLQAFQGGITTPFHFDCSLTHYNAISFWALNEFYFISL